MSMSNKILNTSTETATNELDLNIDELPSFIDVAEKHDAANYNNTNNSYHSKENNATAHHANEIKFTLTPKEIVNRRGENL